ncbi:hypothetical protein [Neobacillus notoginsengisoli]|nr:hypothetical protein [Neobacillus notoginsengisoli]
MKEKIVNNVLYSRVQDIRTNVRKFVKQLGERTEEVIDKLCV